MGESIDKYIITYTNKLVFQGRTFAFRKRMLFDISGQTPLYIPRSEQGWWIGRHLLTPNKAKELTQIVATDIDVSHLQWYMQEQLNGCFNL